MSPIPDVKNEEDVGRCIRFLRKEGKPLDQCQAICMEKLRKSGGGSDRPMMKRTSKDK